MHLKNILKILPQFVAGAPALLACLALANHLAWSSPAIKLFQTDSEAFKITLNETDWVSNSVTAGSIIGIIVFICLPLFGRKPVIIASTFLMTIGWLIIYFAQNVYWLYTSRFISGIGMGIAAMIAPIYLGEIASNNFRGVLTTSFQMMQVTAPIIQYVLVPATSAKISALCNFVFTAISLVLMFWMLESPYYLTIVKNEKQAKKNLQEIRKENVDHEFSLLKKGVEVQLSASKPKLSSLFTVKNNFRAFTILIVVFTVQSFVGTNVLQLKTHQLIDQFHSTTKTEVIAYWLMIIPVIGSLISTIFIDKVGIKPLLIISSSGCFITFLGIAAYFNIQLYQNIDNLSWIPIVCLMINRFVHAIGIGGVPYKLLGEMFSTEIKTYGGSLVKLYVFIAYLLSNIVYDFLNNNLGYHISYYLFALFGLFGTFYITFCVPETKGKSMYDIQIMLGANYEEIENKNKKNVTE